MAELRLCFERGANDIVHKICHRHLLETPNKQGKSATHGLSLSAGFLAVDIEDGRQCEAGKASDGYTRVNRSLCAGNDVRDYNNRCIGHNTEYSLSNEVSVQIRGRHFSRYRSPAEFRSTFCTLRTRSHEQLVFIRPYSGDEARSEPLYKTKTGYYEILEVSPTATHAQIKTAYYKQSFIYHPDRNAGSAEATVRFSDINEAYTVLGNKGLRKRYDRGLLSLSDLTSTARPSSKDTTGSPTRQQAEGRRAVVGADSQEGVFNFDKFFKSHYNEQLQRQRDTRVRREDMLKRKQQSMGEKKMGRMLEMGVGVLLVVAVGLILSLKRG